MNCSVVNIFNVLLHLSIMLITTKAFELGESACRYSGTYKHSDEDCHKDLVELNTLPSTCSSLTFDGLRYTPEEGIIERYKDEDIMKTIEKLVNYEKKTFVFYGRRDNDAWFDAFYSEDHATESDKMKEFVDKHPVGGLILYGLEYPFIVEGVDFYQKFSEYVAPIKTKVPDLSIGIYLDARDIIFHKNDSGWFDFAKLNPSLDFYILQFYDFHSCSKPYLRTGITPMDSTNDTVQTLNKFKDALFLSNIEMDKVHFEFAISPLVDSDNAVKEFKYCEISYSKYCENEKDYAASWCIDNPDTLYQKGQFAKNYSKGFVASDIDLIDRDLKCDCNGDMFITFSMIYNGYKGDEQINCDRLKCK